MTRAERALLGQFRPGTTWLHRLPAGAKLLGLVAVGVTVAVLSGPVPGVTTLIVTVGLALWAGMGWRLTLRTLRGVLLVVALLGGWLVWQQGWARGVEAASELLALVLLATVVTVTTPVEEILEAITRAIGPLRRFGARPESVAMAFSLLIRGLPTTLALADETRDAARARGLDRDPRARLIPLVIRVVAHARATGDALHARGVLDPDAVRHPRRDRL